VAALVDVYTGEIHRELRPLRAQWPIGAPLRLGDYGVLLGARFELRGNLADIGIAVSPRDDAGTDYVSYQSASGVEVELTGGGGATAGGIPVKASCVIGFSAKNAIFMNLAGCRWVTIQNRDALRPLFSAAFARGDWKEHYYFVHRVAEVASATIVISSSNKSSIKLEAEVDIPAINLRDPDLNLAAKQWSDIAARTESQGGLNPLFELGQWERPNPYGPRGMTAEGLPGWGGGAILGGGDTVDRDGADGEGTLHVGV
jgi:hypothetical protein